MSIDHVSVSSHLAHQIIGIQTKGEKMSDRDTDNKDSVFQADTKNTASNTHWALIGRLMTFQFKLAMDGLRDLLLSPVSIGFVLYGILVQREQPDKYFRRLMRFGRDSDDFINLFGEKQETQRPESSSDDKDREMVLSSANAEDFRKVTSDDYVKKLESLILSEYKKGGFITELNQGTDGILEKLQSKAERRRRKSPETDQSTNSDLK